MSKKWLISCLYNRTVVKVEKMNWKNMKVCVNNISTVKHCWIALLLSARPNAESGEEANLSCLLFDFQFF